MRKLLNTLFVISEDSYMTLDGENVVIMSGKDILARFPLHTLENIICFSYKGASPALMGACAARNVGLSFFFSIWKIFSKNNGRRTGKCFTSKRTI